MRKTCRGCTWDNGFGYVTAYHSAHCDQCDSDYSDWCPKDSFHDENCWCPKNCLGIKDEQDV